MTGSLSLTLNDISRLPVTPNEAGPTPYKRKTSMKSLSSFLSVSTLVCSLAQAAPTIYVDVNPQENKKPISPYIYGNNDIPPNIEGSKFSRLGGNRWSAYNWENNASNAGVDWHHQNDGYLSSSLEPGAAALDKIHKLSTQPNMQAVLITIPMLGYVAADKKADGDVNGTPNYLKKRFFKSLINGPRLNGKRPDIQDDFVYQSQFVDLLVATNKADYRNLKFFYSLDNEPALWNHTHARIQPAKISYKKLVKTSIETAQMIKSRAPKSLIFGPALYGFTAFVNLQHAPDHKKHGHFIDYYLKEFAKVEQKTNRKLLDVLDVHWYPEVKANGRTIHVDQNSPEMIRQRVQATRSLWDPTFKEDSWIGKSFGPIKMIPELQKKIDRYKPGTKIAITEYFYGGGSHISGAIAQADALGIFGREGVYAATFWKMNRNIQYIGSAFQMFLNYDGAGGEFGDQSVKATSSDIEKITAYASTSTTDGSITLMIINKSNAPQTVSHKISQSKKVSAKGVWQIKQDQPIPQKLKAPLKVSQNRFDLTVPALSISVMSFQ